MLAGWTDDVGFWFQDDVLEGKIKELGVAAAIREKQEKDGTTPSWSTKTRFIILLLPFLIHRAASVFP